MKKLYPSQQKLLVLAGALVLACFLCWILILFPRQQKLNALKSELRNTEGHITVIEGMFSADKNISEGIEGLEKKLKRLTAKFPAKEEESIKDLSDFGRKTNIEIISVLSQPKAPFLDAGGSPILVDGKNCQVVLVSMQIRGAYKDLVQYLELLKSSLPAYVTIDKLGIHSETSGAPALSIAVDLKLYLLS